MIASSLTQEQRNIRLFEAQRLLLIALADPLLSIDALCVYQDRLARRLDGDAVDAPDEAAARIGMPLSKYLSGRAELASRNYLEADEQA